MTTSDPLMKNGDHSKVKSNPLATERERRRKIKDKMSELKELVPSEYISQYNDKAGILEGISGYIKQLQSFIIEQHSRDPVKFHLLPSIASTNISNNSGTHSSLLTLLPQYKPPEHFKPIIRKETFTERESSVDSDEERPSKKTQIDISNLLM
ncbi:hypothetical protein HDV06_001781 [Boothiomyces sp. JEL0866]|nr:hypothetical protein HDV06_001781 [Boothiomyces sp. JEL0866]